MQKEKHYQVCWDRGSDGVRWPYTEFEPIFAISLYERHSSIHWNLFTQFACFGC